MSTQPPNPTGAKDWPFKTEAEFQDFLKRIVVEEVSPAIDKALAPLSEKQSSLIKEMLEAHQRAEPTKLPKGFGFARMMRAKALTLAEGLNPGDFDAMKHTAKKYMASEDNGEILKAIEGAAKLKATASQAQDATSLGNMILPQYMREIIEMLRKRPVIRGIARVIPNPTGSLSLRRATSDGVAYWVGEGQVITPSKPGVGTMSFLRKKLAALSVVSNDLIRFGGTEVDQYILDSLIAVIALAEDLAFIRGDGTEFSPKGIRKLLAAANIFAQTGTTLAAVDADMAKAIRLVEEANIYAEPGSIHCLMVPRTWWGLWKLAAATDTGFRPYREALERNTAEAPNGYVLNCPTHKTNQIPTNLGGGGNEAERYFVHGPSLWIADTFNNMVDVFPGGAYEDGGATVSGISRDETVMRVIRETDFNMKYDQAGACITGDTLS